MALSKSGRILVSGTQAPVGSQPEIIVWDVEKKEPLATLRQHKGSITDIAISPDDSWFATLGDDNLLVIYPLSDEYKHPLYTPLAGRQFQVPKPCTALLAAEPGLLLVGGDQFLTFVEVDLKARTLADVPARVQLQRRFNCFTRVGDFVYAGTEQGDLIKIDIHSRSPLQSCPAGRPFAGAVTALVGNDQENVICATTAGKFYLVRTDAMVPVASAEVECQTGAGSATATTSALQLGPAQLAAPSPLALAVTCVATGIGSMATSDQCRYAYALGPNCLCRLDKSSLEVRLLQTAPPGVVSPAGVESLTVPLDTSRVYVSACGPFISVWSSVTGAELLRLSVPGVVCNAVRLTPDGQQIVSAWSDGHIRAFGPQSGRTLYMVENVHAGGATALALSRDGAFAFTGGADAKVCVVNLCTQSLL